MIILSQSEKDRYHMIKATRIIYNRQALKGSKVSTREPVSGFNALFTLSLWQHQYASLFPGYQIPEAK